MTTHSSEYFGYQSGRYSSKLPAELGNTAYGQFKPKGFGQVDFDTGMVGGNYAPYPMSSGTMTGGSTAASLRKPASGGSTAASLRKPASGGSTDPLPAMPTPDKPLAAAPVHKARGSKHHKSAKPVVPVAPIAYVQPTGKIFKFMQPKVVAMSYGKSPSVSKKASTQKKSSHRSHQPRHNNSTRKARHL